MNQQLQSDYQTKLINEHEAADYIGHSVRALQNWRVRGGGPRFVKVSGRSIRYRRCDLNEWIETKLVRSTSDVCREAANDA
ncbi:MAG: helix-turn-helix domain-containing protein [Kordiimonadaceae bacterium]|nr:helix-turn-helix domain-containing protein [Kordiimonadaceae bacterium]